jgi:hypothetical protein
VSARQTRKVAVAPAGCIADEIAGTRIFEREKLARDPKPFIPHNLKTSAEKASGMFRQIGKSARAKKRIGGNWYSRGRVHPLWLGLLASAAFAAAACTSWMRLPETQPVPTRGTIQVWSAGQARLLRDPKRAGDSLVGRRPLPDTTAEAVGLTTIDSLRVQSTDIGKTLIVGSGALIFVLLMYAEGFQALGT